MPGAATPELIERLEAAGPFGAGAPGPRFVLPDCRIAHARALGGAHLKLRVDDGLGNGVEAIAFGEAESALGCALLSHGGARFHLAGRLDINDWGGRRRVQLRLEDAAPAG